MTKLYVTSDTHFNHFNIIEFGERPFVTASQMNERLIDNWNSVVSNNDVVWHLGDVGYDSVILKKLNGNKKLIIGNHDHVTPEWFEHFSEIVLCKKYKKTNAKSLGIMMTHMPIHDDNLGWGEDINIHGHLHQRKINDKRYINVSVELTDYKPVLLESIFANIRESSNW